MIVADTTNLAELELVCDACHHVEAPVTFTPWPTHCDQPLRLANTTDRDGRPLEPKGDDA